MPNLGVFLYYKKSTGFGFVDICPVQDINAILNAYNALHKKL
jgi:hypothetical protein